MRRKCKKTEKELEDERNTEKLFAFSENYKSRISVPKSPWIELEPVYSETTHSDGLDLSKSALQGPSPGNISALSSLSKGPEIFSFASMWSVICIEPDYDLVLSQ